MRRSGKICVIGRHTVRKGLDSRCESPIYVALQQIDFVSQQRPLS